MHEFRERTYGDDSMRSRRETIRLVVVLPLAALLGVIAFLAAVAVARGATQTATVSLRTTRLGMVLVNASGHTLYLFGLDIARQAGRSDQRRRQRRVRRQMGRRLGQGNGGPEGCDNHDERYDHDYLDQLRVPALPVGSGSAISSTLAAL